MPVYYTPEEWDKVSRDAYEVYGGDHAFNGEENEGTLGDIGTSLKIGGVSLGRQAAGLADVVTGGLASQALNPWFDRKEREFRNEYSPELQMREAAHAQRVEEARQAGGEPAAAWEAFMGTISDPRLLGARTGESLPSTLTGLIPGVAAARSVRGATAVAGAAKDAVAGATKSALKDKAVMDAARLGGALGEGALGAGGTVNQIVAENTEAGRDPMYGAWSAAPVGAGTAATALAFGKFLPGANKEAALASSLAGRKIAEPLIAQNSKPQTLLKKAWSSAKDYAKTGIQEGAEEGTQAVSETIFPNIAMGRPATEGLGQNIGESAAVGGAMGVGMHAATRGVEGAQRFQQGPRVEDQRGAISPEKAVAVNQAAAETPMNGTTMSRPNLPDGGMPPPPPTAPVYASPSARNAAVQQRLAVLNERLQNAQSEEEARAIQAEIGMLEAAQRQADQQPTQPPQAIQTGQPPQTAQPDAPYSENDTSGEAIEWRHAQEEAKREAAAREKAEQDRLTADENARKKEQNRLDREQRAATRAENRRIKNENREKAATEKAATEAAKAEAAKQTEANRAHVDEVFPRSLKPDAYTGTSGRKILPGTRDIFSKIQHPQRDNVALAMDEANEEEMSDERKRPFSSSEQLAQVTEFVFTSPENKNEKGEVSDDPIVELNYRANNGITSKSKDANKRARVYKRAAIRLEKPDASNEEITAEVNAWEAEKKAEYAKNHPEESKTKGESKPKAEPKPDPRDGARKFFPKALPEGDQGRRRTVTKPVAEKFEKAEIPEKAKVASALDTAYDSVKNDKGNPVFESANQFIDKACDAVTGSKTVEEVRARLKAKAEECKNSTEPAENRRASVYNLAAELLDPANKDENEARKKAQQWDEQKEAAIASRKPKQAKKDTSSTKGERGKLQSEHQFSNTPGEDEVEYVRWKTEVRDKLPSEVSEALTKSIQIAMQQTPELVKGARNWKEVLGRYAVNLTNRYLSYIADSKRNTDNYEISTGSFAWFLDPEGPRSGEDLKYWKAMGIDTNCLGNLSVALSNGGKVASSKEIDQERIEKDRSDEVKIEAQAAAAAMAPSTPEDHGGEIHAREVPFYEGTDMPHIDDPLTQWKGADFNDNTRNADDFVSETAPQKEYPLVVYETPIQAYLDVLFDPSVDTLTKREKFLIDAIARGDFTVEDIKRIIQDRLYNADEERALAEDRQDREEWRKAESKKQEEADKAYREAQTAKYAEEQPGVKYSYKPEKPENAKDRNELDKAKVQSTKRENEAERTFLFRAFMIPGMNTFDRLGLRTVLMRQLHLKNYAELIKLTDPKLAVGEDEQSVLPGNEASVEDEEANEIARKHWVTNGDNDYNNDDEPQGINRAAEKSHAERRAMYVRGLMFKYIAEAAENNDVKGVRWEPVRKIGIDGQTVQDNLGNPVKESSPVLPADFIKQLQANGKMDNFVKDVEARYAEIATDLATQVYNAAKEVRKTDSWREHVQGMAIDIIGTAQQVFNMAQLKSSDTRFGAFLTDIFYKTFIGTINGEKHNFTTAKKETLEFLEPFVHRGYSLVHFSSGKALTKEQAEKLTLTEEQMSHLFTLADRSFYLGKPSKNVEVRTLEEAELSNGEYFAKSKEAEFPYAVKLALYEFYRNYVKNEAGTSGKKFLIRGEFDQEMGAFYVQQAVRLAFGNMFDLSTKRDWYKAIKNTTGTYIQGSSVEEPIAFSQIIPSPLDSVSGMYQFFEKFLNVKDLAKSPTYAAIMNDEAQRAKHAEYVNAYREYDRLFNEAKTAKDKAEYARLRRDAKDAAEHSAPERAYVQELIQEQQKIRYQVAIRFSSNDGQFFLGLYREGLRHLLYAPTNYAGTRTAMLEKFDRAMRRAVNTGMGYPKGMKEKLLSGMDDALGYTKAKVEMEEMTWQRADKRGRISLNSETIKQDHPGNKGGTVQVDTGVPMQGGEAVPAFSARPTNMYTKENEISPALEIPRSATYFNRLEKEVGAHAKKQNQAKEAQEAQEEAAAERQERAESTRDLTEEIPSDGSARSIAGGKSAKSRAIRARRRQALETFFPKTSNMDTGPEGDSTARGISDGQVQQLNNEFAQRPELTKAVTSAVDEANAALKEEIGSSAGTTHGVVMEAVSILASIPAHFTNRAVVGFLDWYEHFISTALFNTAHGNIGTLRYSSSGKLDTSRRDTGLSYGEVDKLRWLGTWVHCRVENPKASTAEIRRAVLARLSGVDTVNASAKEREEAISAAEHRIQQVWRRRDDRTPVRTPYKPASTTGSMKERAEVEVNRPWQETKTNDLNAIENCGADKQLIDNAVFVSGEQGGIVILADIAMDVLIRNNFNPACLEGVFTKSTAIAIAKMCKTVHEHGSGLPEGLLICDGNQTSVNGTFGSRFTIGSGTVRGKSIRRDWDGSRQSIALEAPSGVITIRGTHPSAMSPEYRAALGEDSRKAAFHVENLGIHELIHAKIAEGRGRLARELAKRITPLMLDQLRTMATTDGPYRMKAKHALDEANRVFLLAMQAGYPLAECHRIGLSRVAEELLAEFFAEYSENEAGIRQFFHDSGYHWIENFFKGVLDNDGLSLLIRGTDDRGRSAFGRELWRATHTRSRAADDFESSNGADNSSEAGRYADTTGVDVRADGRAREQELSKGSSGRASENSNENIPPEARREVSGRLQGNNPVSGHGAGTQPSVPPSRSEVNGNGNVGRVSSGSSPEGPGGQGNLRGSGRGSVLSAGGNRETSGERAARRRLEASAQNRIIARLPKKFRPFARTAASLLKDGGMQLMFSRNFVNEFKHILPSIERWWRAVENLMNTRQQWQQEAADIVEGISKLSKDEQHRLNDLAIESTLSDFWAYRDKEVFPTEQAWKDYVDRTFAKSGKEYSLFLKKYDALSAAAKKAFNDLFAMGTKEKQRLVQIKIHDEHATMEPLIKNAPTLEKRKELERKYAITVAGFRKDLARALEHPYVPLSRHGNHVVTYRSGDYLKAEKELEKYKEKLAKLGRKPNTVEEKTLRSLREILDKYATDENHYVVEFYDSLLDANKRYEDLLDQFPDAAPESIQKFEKQIYLDSQAPKWATSSELLRQLTKMQQDSVGKDELTEKDIALMTEVLQEQFIRNLPDVSARKAQLKRRGVAGYNDDVIQNFVRHAQASSHLIASLEGSQEIHDALEAVNKESKAHAETGTRDEASVIANEVRRRQKLIFSSTDPGITGKVMRATSFWMLLTNPAFYLQNLLQPGMMSAPYINGALKINCLGELTNTMKAIADFVSKDKSLRNLKDTLSDDEYEALMHARNRQLLTVGITSELGEVSDNTAFGRTTNWFTKKAQTIEIINRVSTHLVAYRNALKKGMTHEEAMEFAERVIVQTHGDYSKENAPSLFIRNNFMKMTTQFRKFPFIQGGLILRMLRDSVNKELDPTERAIARRQLMWIVGTHFAMAGLKGTPLVAQVMAAVGFVMGMGGSGDDEEDLIRKAVADKDVSDFLLTGIPSLIGLDLSKKVGAGDFHNPLPFYEFDVTKGKRNALELFFNAAGAWASVSAKFFEGAMYAWQGDYAKGIEKMLPNGLASNGLKALRLSLEGYTTAGGDVLIKPDKFSPWDFGGTAIGLTTSTVGDRTRLQGSLLRHENEFNNTKKLIQRRLDEAKESHDYAGMREAWKDLAELNRHREAAGFTPIKRTQLESAYKAKKKREANAVGGLVSTKQNRGFLERNSKI